MTTLPPQLIALSSAIIYAAGTLSARVGLEHSNPTTMTLISLLVHTTTLWSIVFFIGGIPKVTMTPIILFTIVGFLLAVIRLLTYTGISKIGAARSAPLRSIHPLFSTLIAIFVLHEEPRAVVISGILLITAGIILISWQPSDRVSTFPRRYVFYPISASILSGIVHPIMRYALSLSNHPLFYAALVGFVSLVTLLGYLATPGIFQQLAWNRKALRPFLMAGLFETLGFLLFSAALSVGSVVFVAPIIGTIPMWVLLGAIVILRNLERVNLRTVLGTCSAVAGTIAISLEG